MCYLFDLYLNKVTRNLLPLLFIDFFNSTMAMEQIIKKEKFIDVPIELKTKIVFNAVGYVKNIDEAIIFLHTCKQANQEIKLKDIVENEQNSVFFVKTLHKKFEIPKLQVRYMLRTNETKTQLLKKKDIIAKYAFLHHNTLLLNILLRERVHHGTALSLVSLERSFQ